jgi:hypothetical protein
VVDPKDFDTMNSELEDRLDDLFGENDIQLPDASDEKLKEYYPLAELKNLILSIDWEITDEVLDSLIQQLKDLQLTYEHDKIVSMFLQILHSLGNYIRAHRAKAHPKTFKILNSVFSSLDKVVLSKDMTEPAKKKILRAEMNRYKELRTQIAKSKAAAAKRQAQPVATQEPKIKYKKEEPAIKPDEPSAAPDFKEKEDAPDAVLDEPSVVPDLKAPEKEPVIFPAEPSEPPAVTAEKDLPVTRPDSETDPAMAALADAVEEIKQYIHTEIKALREEIQSLRESR